MLARGLLDRYLVQRPVADDDPAVAAYRHVEGKPLFDLVVAREDLLGGHVDRDRVGLREEADMAEVDAEQRDAVRPGQLRGAQQGAVAAESDDQLGVLGRVLGGSDGHAARAVEDGSLGLEHPDGHAGLAEPARQVARDVDRRLPPGMGDQQDRAALGPLTGDPLRPRR